MILELFQNGTMKQLFDRGIISVNIYTYYRYYQVYQAYKAKGHSNNKAYQFASDECGISEVTIRKAVKLITA
jgi:hypothetical protein